MSNIDNWQYVVAFVSPFLVSLINKPTWSAQVKRWVMIAVAFVIALVTGILEGAFTPFDAGQLLSYIVLMIGATQVAYAALNGLTVTRKGMDRLELVGSGKTAREAVEAKAEVKAYEVQDFQTNVAA